MVCTLCKCERFEKLKIKCYVKPQVLKIVDVEQKNVKRSRGHDHDE